MARLARATALLSLERRGQAMEELDWILARRELPDALVERGLLRAALGRLVAARVDLERLLELVPDHPRAEEARSALAGMRR